MMVVNNARLETELFIGELFTSLPFSYISAIGYSRYFGISSKLFEFVLKVYIIWSIFNYLYIYWIYILFLYILVSSRDEMLPYLARIF